MGALDVGHMFPQQVRNEVRIAIDDAGFDANHSSLLALFDHLHILPASLRALLGRGTPLSLVGRYLSIDRKQGLAMSTPAIRCQSRWLVAVAARFEQGKGLL